MPVKSIVNLETDLVRARRILSSWTLVRRLSGDEAGTLVRMIVEGIAEGRRLGWEKEESEWLSDGKTKPEEPKGGLHAEVDVYLHATSERSDLARTRHIVRRRLLCTP